MSGSGAKVTIKWIDGKQTDIDAGSISERAAGEGVMAELEFRFDDVSEGLFVEARHYEAVADDRIGAEVDRRGAKCILVNDWYAEIVPVWQIDDVAEVSLDGERKLARINGELASMSKLNSLMNAYLPADTSVIEAISVLYRLLEKEVERDAVDENGEVDEERVADEVARRMGLSRSLIATALEQAPELPSGLADAGGRSLPDAAPDPDDLDAEAFDLGVLSDGC